MRNVDSCLFSNNPIFFTVLNLNVENTFVVLNGLFKVVNKKLDSLKGALRISQFKGRKIFSFLVGSPESFNPCIVGVR